MSSLENGLAAEAGLHILSMYTIRLITPKTKPLLENGLAAEAGLHVLLMHTIKLHTPESQS